MSHAGGSSSHRRPTLRRRTGLLQTSRRPSRTGTGGYSLLAVYLLPSGLRPFPGPVCCSGAVSFWKGADGFCCAGAEADDGGLVAVGAAVSVSLRLRRGWWAGGLDSVGWDGAVE